jgi:hypothetical protein
MATAYNHMKPFQRVNSFVAAKIYEIEKEIELLESERRMWGEKEVQSLLGVIDTSAENFKCNTRLGELQVNELPKWKAFQAKLMRCQGCNGCGEYYIHESQDSGHYEKCVHCGGTGKNPNR